MAKDVLDLIEHKDIESLRKDLIALKRENNAALKTIDKLLKELNKKNEEIESLKSIVSQTTPVIVAPTPETNVIKVEISAEEEIADIQLEKLRKISKDRQLTLEETRMFDLLVKNKRLSQDQATVNLGKKDYRDVTPTELIAIAGAKDVKPED